MSSKEKIVIFSVTFGVVVLALICFIIYPLFRGIEKGSQELITAKKEFILSKDETERFDQFKEIYNKLKPDLEKIDKLFIDPEVPIDFIKFLEYTAGDSELLADISLTLAKSAETDPWSSIGFRMILTGSFPNFLKFLEKIETSPYLIEIQNLSTKKLEEGNIAANLVIKVFSK